MVNTDKIVDAVIWLFNLLTFLAAVLVFLLLCHVCYENWKLFNSIGIALFITLLLLVNIGVIWKTRQWVFSKTEQIYVPGLLSFWVFLVITYLVTFGIGIASAGYMLSG